LAWKVGLALLVAALLLGLWQLVLRQAETAIRAALGPEVCVASIGIAWNGVDIDDVTVAAPSGWPAKHAARVARVRVIPEWFSLLSGGLRVSRIEMSGAEVFVWRTPQGRWRALPAFTEKRSEAGKPVEGKTSKRSMTIGRIDVAGAIVTLIDGTVAPTPHRISVRDLAASIEGLRIGAEPAPMRLSASGRIGEQGGVKVEGTLTPSTFDSDLGIALQRVALSQVEPYLLKAAEAGVQRGEFDLQMRLNIAARVLDAPGRITVRELELKPAMGATTFMGLPREALVERLKDRDGRIDIPFHLAGRLDDPSFSVGAAFKAKLALAAADVLGLQQLLGQWVQKSGVGAQVERAAEKIKQWFSR
jgi:hypothetical protein